MDVIRTLAKQFPQLYLAPEQGVSQSKCYRSIVGKGMAYTGDLQHFQGSPEDRLTMEHTPAGDVMVVYLANRADFECCYQIMAYRCEPVEIPPSVGSCYIRGLNDWSRIHAHRAQYLAQGGQDWSQEFARFTAEPANYKTTVILLSNGPYSALPAAATPYSHARWLDISRDIRKYHELTHFVCRARFPEKKHAVWDELLADCMGMVFATDNYDAMLAQAFLGIVNGRYIGGRLEYYISQLPDEALVSKVCCMIDTLAERCSTAQADGLDGYDLMMLLESETETICDLCGMPIVKPSDE